MDLAARLAALGNGADDLPGGTWDPYADEMPGGTWDPYAGGHPRTFLAPVVRADAKRAAKAQGVIARRTKSPPIPMPLPEGQPPIEEPEAEPGAPIEHYAATAPIWPWLLGGAAVVAAGVGVVLYVRKRKRSGRR